MGPGQVGEAQQPSHHRTNLILVGVAVMASGGGANFLGAVPFGLFGPHVAGWACGVAGAAWAAKMKPEHAA